MNKTIVVVINDLGRYELEEKIQTQIEKKENDNFCFHSSNITTYKNEYGKLEFSASLFFTKIEENIKSF